MIAVNKADECIQGEISRHEEISVLRPNKRRVVGQHMKRLNNEKTREKYITNKRKVRDQPDSGHGERKPKLLFQKHKTNKRKERDQSVEKLSRKKAKKLDGVDVYTHPQ